MKKIAIVLSLIMVLGVFSTIGVNAAKCNHNKTKSYYDKGNWEYHALNTKCTKCGKILTSKGGHHTIKRQVTNISNSQHRIKAYCPTCGKVFTDKKYNHSYKITHTPNGSSKHKTRYKCRECSYDKTYSFNHEFKNKKCTRCGYKK